jgi:hypothetical protein
MPGQAWLYADALRGTLRNIPKVERARLLLDGFAASDGIGAITWTTSALILGQKDLSEEERLLSESELQEIRDAALVRIRAAAGSHELLHAAHLAMVLHNWARWVGPADIERFILEVAAESHRLATLLERLLGESVSGRGVTLHLDIESLASLADLSKLVDRVRALANEAWLSENEQIAVREFISGYDRRDQVSRQR